MSKRKPIGAFVIVKLNEEKEKSTKIILAEGSMPDRERQGTVVAVGTKCNLGVEEGHQVTFKSGAAGEFLDKEQTIVLLPEVSLKLIVNYSDS